MQLPVPLLICLLVLTAVYIHQQPRELAPSLLTSERINIPKACLTSFVCLSLSLSSSDFRADRHALEITSDSWVRRTSTAYQRRLPTAKLIHIHEVTAGRVPSVDPAELKPRLRDQSQRRLDGSSLAAVHPGWPSCRWLQICLFACLLTACSPWFKPQNWKCLGRRYSWSETLQ